MLRFICYNNNMTNYLPRLTNFISENSLIESNDSILMAVSGGADSLCMLFLLEEYGRRFEEKEIRLGVVCVNHGFRPEAALEAEYVGRICKERDIPFFLKEIPSGECRNSEEAARDYRYRLILETAEENGYNKIALAHNAQDRAETILFNLFRGTGITGLVGIRPVRDNFIRPILWMEREEIEAYLKSLGIEWCTDQTNLEDDYSRNKIRHRIIPEAIQINSGAVAHIGETAKRLSEIEEFILSQAKRAANDLAYHRGDEICLEVSKLRDCPSVIRVEIYRLLISDKTKHLKDITADHLKSIDELVDRDSNAEIYLPYGIKVLRSYDELIFLREEISGLVPDISNKYSLEQKIYSLEQIDGDLWDVVPRNKYTKWFDYDKINAACYLRTKVDGDSIVVDSLGHTKTVNRYMIEQKIPKYMRDRIPLVATDSDILWVVGYRDSSAYRIDEGTTRILEIKVKVEE